MSNIKFNKTNNPETLRAIRQSEIKATGKNDAQSVENKAAIDGDKVDFSSRATEAGKLADQIKELPDVRQEKVNALREKISTGEYQPSSEEIADAILKDEGNG